MATYPAITVSRTGQSNASGAVDALFLKVFAGEVMAQFNESQVTMNRHVVKTITHGKSAQFPATGTATAAYHTVGQNILNDAGTAYISQISHAERVITIDDLLVSGVLISDIDEAMNHYSSRAEYSLQVGQALAEQWDQHVLQISILAARATATITGNDAGTVLARGATVSKDPRKLYKSIVEAVSQIRKNKVPASQQIYVYLRPDEFFMLADDPKIMSQDMGGVGSVATGRFPGIFGTEAIMTQNLPSTDIATNGSQANKGTGDKYQGDFSDTIALACTSKAVGTVKLMDLSVESERKIEYQADLLLSKYSVGHGILRPECAVEITKA
jgi:hypothetical protein